MSDEENYIQNRQPGWREESQLEKQKAASELAPAPGSARALHCWNCGGELAARTIKTLHDGTVVGAVWTR